MGGLCARQLGVARLRHDRDDHEAAPGEAWSLAGAFCDVAELKSVSLFARAPPLITPSLTDTL